MLKFEKVLSAIISVLGEEQGNNLLNILHDEGNDNNGHYHNGQRPDQSQKIDKLTEAIQPVCERYRKTEEQNFSLFQFVNEISHDVKRLNEKINNTVNDKKLQKSDTQKKVSNHTTTITQIKCNLQDHESDLKNLDLRMRATHENFNNVKNKIDSLFTTLKCESSNLENMLDNNHEVTPQNLNLYLASIENTINHLLELEAQEKSERAKLDELNGNGNGKKGGENNNTLGKISIDAKSLSKGDKKMRDALSEISPGVVDTVEGLYVDLEKGLLDGSNMRERAKQMVSERIRTNTPRRKTKAKL